MGFFSGRAAFLRFRVQGKAPRSFGEEYLEKLAAHAIGKQRIVSADGIEAGWIGGDHILDTEFELEKNIVNDTLHFALRIDQQKIPSDLLRAYTMVELRALAAGNPSGTPSARQRREARASARERLDQQASDGRFLRRKAYPVLWDGQANELLVGTTSSTALDRIHILFHKTFDRRIELNGAGGHAYRLAELREQTRSVEDAAPATFAPGEKFETLAWIPDEGSRDFLGNEYLLWLWYVLDDESDVIKAADGSEISVMLARSLVLECPRGQTGRESIRSDSPVTLPEARRAIQAGKLPGQAGLTIVRHDHQYELTLHAETLAVTGAKLPAPEAEEERARLDERVTQIRHLAETLDLLYDAFGRHRLSSDWPKELAKIRKWIERDSRDKGA